MLGAVAACCLCEIPTLAARPPNPRENAPDPLAITSSTTLLDDKPAKPREPKPGYATGRITSADGKPIAIKDVSFAIFITGRNETNTIQFSYAPEVDEDGNYEQKLKPGFIYRTVSVIMDIPFNERKFQLELSPVGNAAKDRSPEKGFVQDYVWKLQGGRPVPSTREKNDEFDYNHWYGATVQMQYKSFRDDTRANIPPAPKGSKCVFTLTPKGKMIDGGAGKEVTFTREYDPLFGVLKNDGIQTDLILGNYTVKGVEVAEDGSKKPLVFWQLSTKTYVESIEIGFVPYPRPNIGIDPRMISFTRQ